VKVQKSLPETGIHPFKWDRKGTWLDWRKEGAMDRNEKHIFDRWSNEESHFLRQESPGFAAGLRGLEIAGENIQRMDAMSTGTACGA